MALIELPAFSLTALAAAGLFTASQGTDYTLFYQFMDFTELLLLRNS